MLGPLVNATCRPASRPGRSLKEPLARRSRRSALLTRMDIGPRAPLLREQMALVWTSRLCRRAGRPGPKADGRPCRPARADLIGEGGPSPLGGPRSCSGKRPGRLSRVAKAPPSPRPRPRPGPPPGGPGPSCRSGAGPRMLSWLKAPRLEETHSWAAHRTILSQPALLRVRARVLVVGGEQVAARGHGVRMVAAQHPLPCLQGLLEQRDGLIRPARVPVGGGQVMPREFRVLGCSAPSTVPGRPGSARTAASPRRPGRRPDSKPRGCSASSGSGVVGTELPLAGDERLLVRRHRPRRPGPTSR